MIFHLLKSNPCHFLNDGRDKFIQSKLLGGVKLVIAAKTETDKSFYFLI
jgi:hypothetical protein